MLIKNAIARFRDGSAITNQMRLGVIIRVQPIRPAPICIGLGTLARLHPMPGSLNTPVP